MRKNSSSSKSNKTIKRSHLFVEGRDDDNEYKYVDIENIGKREDIQLGAANTKWGLLPRCTKRNIPQIIIAIVTMRICWSMLWTDIDKSIKFDKETTHKYLFVGGLQRSMTSSVTKSLGSIDGYSQMELSNMPKSDIMDKKPVRVYTFWGLDLHCNAHIDNDAFGYAPSLVHQDLQKTMLHEAPSVHGKHIVVFGHSFYYGEGFGMEKRFTKVMEAFMKMGLTIHYICEECVEEEYSPKGVISHFGKTYKEQVTSMFEYGDECLAEKVVAVVNFFTHIGMKALY